jgi:hypothetical protein
LAACFGFAGFGSVGLAFAVFGGAFAALAAFLTVFFVVELFAITAS